MVSEQKTKFKDVEIEKIPSDWKNKRMGECCYLVKKQFTPSKDDIRPYIGLEHIEQQTLRLINLGSSENIKSNKFEFNSGQILFGKLRPYFRKLYLPRFDGVCSTDIWVIDTKEGNDNSFFFYFFADNRLINEADKSSQGTKMPRAKWDYLEKLEYPIPPLNEQKTIAKILSDLDSKIELNQQMNKTLEAIGQVLFKHWFIDFEFPNKGGKPYKSSGGEMVYSKDLDKEIPVRWKEGILSDLVEISTDSVRPKDELYYHYSIPSFDKNKFPNLENGNLIKSNKYIVKKNSILLSKLNPRFYRLWLPFDNFNNSICSTEFIVFIPKFDNSKIFCFFLSNSKYMRYQLISHATGTTGSRQRVKPNDTLKFELVIPPKEIIQKFNDTTTPLLLKFLNNQIESRYLESIRDILLPKLISGQIRVPVEVD